jgi:serine/threonine protein kinase
MVYLEDTSSNGTFLNKIKLKRRERRHLSTGDELTFLSPKISEARRTAFMYVSLTDTSLTTIPQLATDPDALISERSLTLAASSTNRHLENDYELREELGSGSIGKVYRAIERSTDKSFAAKIIPTRQFAFERSFSANDLLQEARMLRNVSHPAIVTVRDAYSEETSFAIVMQLVEGGDLFDRIITRKRYPERDARDVMRQLLSALAYLHARGIAHRDIKPENILLRSVDSDVDVLLTDFGLAKGTAVGPHGCTTFCGTPQYLAPEVMERQNEDDLAIGGYDGAAADIWSLGVVLFVLLSGTQPANSKVENKWTTCSFSESIWQGISEEAKDAVRRLTAIDANERPSAAAALLMPWFTGQHTSSKRTGTIDRANDFKRQKT